MTHNQSLKRIDQRDVFINKFDLLCSDLFTHSGVHVLISNHFEVFMFRPLYTLRCSCSDLSPEHFEVFILLFQHQPVVLL